MKEAAALYDEGRLLSEIVEYDWDEHYDTMMDLMTGLVGLCIREKFDYLTGPQIGSKLPVMVLNLPHGMPQILIDPEIEYKKGPHLVVSALSYQGESIKIDTKRISYTNGEEMALAIEHALEHLTRHPRQCY